VIDIQRFTNKKSEKRRHSCLHAARFFVQSLRPWTYSRKSRRIFRKSRRTFTRIKTKLDHAIGLNLSHTSVAIAVSTAATKAHRANGALLSGPGRKFLLSFSPPIIVGGLLTFALFQTAAQSDLPGIWLLLYGTAIVTGGAFSVRVVPMMGVALMALGAIALFAPSNWGDAFMAAGFGGLQIAFGVWIARHHGG